MRKLLLIFAGIYAINWARKKVDVANYAKFDIVGINIGGSLLAPVLKVTLRIYNSTGTAALLNGINGNFFIDAAHTHLVSGVSWNGSLIIPANGYVDVPITMSGNDEGILLLVANLAKKIPTILYYNGSITAEHVTFPLDLQLDAI